MIIAQSIEQKVIDAIQPLHLEVTNESHMHNVPPDSESHFKVTVVSTEFDGKMLVARHRILNQLLKDELEGPVHALSLNTLTPEEWQEKRRVWFKDWQEKNKEVDQDTVLDFHRNGGEGHPNFDVVMKWKDLVCTTSITSILKDEKKNVHAI